MTSGADAWAKLPASARVDADQAVISTGADASAPSMADDQRRADLAVNSMATRAARPARRIGEVDVEGVFGHGVHRVVEVDGAVG